MEVEVDREERSSKRCRSVVEVFSGKRFDSISDAAAFFKVRASDITLCCQGKRSFVENYVFEYFDPYEVRR
jgi:hypothetical protein